MPDKDLSGDPEAALAHEMAHAYGMTVAGERLTPQRRELMPLLLKINIVIRLD